MKSYGNGEGNHWAATRKGAIARRKDIMTRGNLLRSFIILALLLVWSRAIGAAPLGTGFTYQGRLSEGTSLAPQGSYDMRFALFDDATNGSPVGPELTHVVSVSNGLFLLHLDFGNAAFNGEARWLEIGVRPRGSTNEFTLLNPRQALTPRPYALHAAVAGAVAASNLVGLVPEPLLPPAIPRLDGSSRLRGSSLPTNVAFLDAHQSFTGSNTLTGVTLLRNPDNQFAGTFAGGFTGDGASLTNLDPASLRPGTAPINISGNAVTASTAAVAGTAALALNAMNLIGRLEGDVTGTQDATIVGGLRGVAIAATSPAAHQHLRFDGAQWTPGAVALGSDVSGALPLAHGGTGAATASEARAQLGAAANGANADITSLSGLVTPLSVEQGGTGSGLQNFVDLLTEQAIAGGKVFRPTTDVTGLVVRQTSADGPTNDVFAVQDPGGATNYLRVNSSGNLSWSGLASGDGAGLTNLDAGSLSSGTLPDARLSPNVALLNTSPVFSGPVTILGDLVTSRLNIGLGNTLAGEYGTIAGGAANTIRSRVGMPPSDYSMIGGGSGNSVTGSRGATIVGGSDNEIESFSGQEASHYAAIGGGTQNQIESYSAAATIGGGDGNQITYSRWATVGGGKLNQISVSGGATIGGGVQNWISSVAGNVTYSTIGGGLENRIETVAYATIAGGRNNLISGTSFGSYAALGGGRDNTVLGRYATIPGGEANEATDYGFAAGRRAKAQHAGAFVWGDSTDQDVASTTNNQFLVRAAGGVRLLSSTNEGSAVDLPSGSGAWSSLADREALQRFEEVLPRQVLSQLVTLPIQTWGYQAQDPSVRHIGPTAQDFRTAFGLGENEQQISTVDADGVALAAIQGLNEIVTEQQAALAAKDARIEALERSVAELRILVTNLVQTVSGSTP